MGYDYTPPAALRTPKDDGAGGGGKRYRVYDQIKPFFDDYDYRVKY